MTKKTKPEEIISNKLQDDRTTVRCFEFLSLQTHSYDILT